MHTYTQKKYIIHTHKSYIYIYIYIKIKEPSLSYYLSIGRWEQLYTNLSPEY